MKVHGCCGCSCHICAKGHNAGRGEHTDACRERFYAEWEQENVEEPTCGFCGGLGHHPNGDTSHVCPECNGEPENVEEPTGG